MPRALSTLARLRFSGIQIGLVLFWAIWLTAVTATNIFDAMKQLAAQTGGAVIEPSQTTPIDFRWPPRIVSLVSILSISGAVFIGLGLILWKLQ